MGIHVTTFDKLLYTLVYVINDQFPPYTKKAVNWLAAENNPFHAKSLLYPLKIAENLWCFDVFGGPKERPLV